MDFIMDELYELTDEQQKAIETGREQIRNGKFKKHEDVMRDMREWLSKNY
jgi:predicted transcriptional regulator